MLINSSVQTFLFHPLHPSHSNIKKWASVITIVALTILSLGAFAFVALGVNYFTHRVKPVGGHTEEPVEAPGNGPVGRFVDSPLTREAKKVSGERKRVHFALSEEHGTATASGYKLPQRSPPLVSAQQPGSRLADSPRTLEPFAELPATAPSSLPASGSPSSRSSPARSPIPHSPYAVHLPKLKAEECTLLLQRTDLDSPEKVKRLQASHMQILRELAEKGDWSLLQKHKKTQLVSYFDYWMFPTDRELRQYKELQLTRADIAKLQADRAFRDSYLAGVKLVALSWGITLDKGAPLSPEQNWAGDYSQAFQMRFGRMLQSLECFGQRRLISQLVGQMRVKQMDVTKLYSWIQPYFAVSA